MFGVPRNGACKTPRFHCGFVINPRASIALPSDPELRRFLPGPLPLQAGL